MKKITLSAISALLATASAAYAADLPRRAAPVIVAPVPTFSWTGFYAGLNAGYAWSNDTIRNTSADNNVGLDRYIAQSGFARVRPDSNGFVGGGQVGYNHQFSPGNSFVVGVEADAQYADLQKRKKLISHSSGSGTLGSFSETDAYQVRNSIGFLGTVRGRLGYAFDRVLVYGTGGLAYGQVKFDQSYAESVTFTPNQGAAPSTYLNQTTGRSDRTQTGYVFGGGVEYALPTDSFLNFVRANAVTVRAEYLRYDLGKRTVVSYNTEDRTPTFKSKVETEGNIIRAAVNYKFGSY